MLKHMGRCEAFLSGKLLTAIIIMMFNGLHLFQAAYPLCWAQSGSVALIYITYIWAAPQLGRNIAL